MALISSPTAHLLTKPTVQAGDEQEHHGPGPPLHHHVQLAITVGSQQHAHPLQIQPPLAAQGDKKEHHAVISTSSSCHCNIFSFSISWNKLDSLFKLICPIIFTRWSCLPVRQVSKTHLKTQSRINSPEDVGGDSEPYVDALALASGVQELREGVQDLHEHHALHPCACTHRTLVCLVPLSVCNSWNKSSSHQITAWLNNEHLFPCA